MFAVLWAGPAAAASTLRAASPVSAPPSRAVSTSVSSSRPQVKYYIVPRTKSGAALTLFKIAAKTLGDGSRFMEIFNLNKGRLQPNGRRVSSPNVIEPGWILRLPNDASGPGVHFGQMPNVRRHTSRPGPGSRAASPPAAASSPAGAASVPGKAAAGGALILLAAAGLAVVLLRRRRREGASGRPKAAHAKPGPLGDGWQGAPGPGTPGPGTPAGPAQPGRPHPGDLPRRRTGPRDPVAGDPGSPSPGGEASRPAAPVPSYHAWVPQPAGQPGWSGTPHPAGPDWPHTPDHPSWPNTATTDHPSWPSTPGGPLRPHTEPAPTLHHDPYRQPAPPLSPAPAMWGAAGRPGQHARPRGGGSVVAGPWPAEPGTRPAQPEPWRAQPQQWSAQPVMAGPGSRTYHDLALSDSRRPMVLTEPPPGTAPAWGAHTGEMLALTGHPAVQFADPAQWDAEQHRITDSIRLAERTLADADHEAAAIRHDASVRAAAIAEAAEREADQTRDQASAQAVAVREAAEREIAELRHAAEQQAIAVRESAGQQAIAVREAAERDAAELRATLQAMSAELTRVAGYVTENLATPLTPVSAPGAQPATRPATEPTPVPAGRPTAKPASKPGAKPAARPASKPTRGPANKPAAPPAVKPKGRQLSAMRKMVAALVAFCLVGAVSGATELAMHGFSFFVFRNAGTGAGNSQDLNENQGPGQPGAPGKHHHKAHVGRPGSKPSGKPAKSHKPAGA